MVKILSLSLIGLLAIIGVVALFKQNSADYLAHPSPNSVPSPIEIELEKEIHLVEAPSTTTIKAPELPIQGSSQTVPSPVPNTWPLSAEDLPTANRIEELFNLEEPKLPIVETITYKSRVDWQKGSPAWVSDYASHYATSRHFIARSLNKKPDYLKQDVADGNRFNVLRPDKKIQFHLLIDISRCKMWFSYQDMDTGEKVLLKTYDVGLGRFDNSKSSGLLTPLGKYSLGNRIATYKGGMMGHHKGQKTEMIQVFGTRWIPFEKELANTTAPAKGYGLHGVPWQTDRQTGQLTEDRSSLGRYESDGCIRLAAGDIEEIYAIVITKPSIVELVRDYYDSEFAREELE